MPKSLEKNSDKPFPDLNEISPEPTSWDQEAYLEITSTKLSLAQQESIISPKKIYPDQKTVLAVHWHPEFISMDLIEQRVTAMFPYQEKLLIIPTQHNVIMAYGDFAGVEVDCYSKEFNRKVQLLLHFSQSHLKDLGFLKQMLSHTFRYRAGQLYEFLETIVNPSFDDRIQKACSLTGVDHQLVLFVKIYIERLKRLIDHNKLSTLEDAFKNKLVRNYFDKLRDIYPFELINKAQIFLRAIKEIVKANFNMEYFYETREIIEEARGVHSGIVIPHPEQFWPILLADYDVDGIEVWNPQSREYTEFLIHVVNSQNKNRPQHKRPLLVFMGDDTHMSEKVRDHRFQDPEKLNRELGVQPAWEDMAIRKSLALVGFTKEKTIDEYIARLQ